MAAAVARGLLRDATMRSKRLPTLLLLSVLFVAPSVHAAGAVAPMVVAPSATRIDLVVTEMGKDGKSRATTLSLSLPDRSSGGPATAELQTQVSGERGEAVGYTAKVRPEDTTAGTRYAITLRRTGGVELWVESARVLKVGAAVEIGKVMRPDGSGMTVTATLR